MIYIDGSQGEGGGQVLRTALSLSILTRQPVQVEQIRAGRPKPGLQAQHLKAVDAAAAISRAAVRGASLNSRSLVFEPGEIRSGRYKFDIGTAGATSLVLQTILLPLAQAGSASTVIITGGTHVQWSPSYHYLEWHWMPFLLEMGLDVKLSLDQAGFYPEGNGRITATIRPLSGSLAPLKRMERGRPLRVQGISAVSNLSRDIAERQKRQALRRLEALQRTYELPSPRIKTVELPSRFKGTALLLLVEFEGGRCCYTGLGRLGKPAEEVADDALDGLAAFLATDATVDEYMADQLLLPLVLAGGPSEFRTSRITGHLLTNADIIAAFLPARIDIQGQPGEPGIVHIQSV